MQPLPPTEAIIPNHLEFLAQDYQNVKQMFITATENGELDTFVQSRKDTLKTLHEVCFQTISLTSNIYLTCKTLEAREFMQTVVSQGEREL